MASELQLREGSYVHVGRPVLTCIDGDQWSVVRATFARTASRTFSRAAIGMTFNNYPGRVFPGVVQTVGWGVDQGQGSPSGSLPNVGEPKMDPARPALRCGSPPEMPPGSLLRLARWRVWRFTPRTSTGSTG